MQNISFCLLLYIHVTHGAKLVKEVSIEPLFAICAVCVILCPIPLQFSIIKQLAQQQILLRSLPFWYSLLMLLVDCALPRHLPLCCSILVHGIFLSCP